MPVDFPPVFYTATMVKILREQGSSQYAMELAELILKVQPEQEEVLRLRDEMKEEARRAFERFKSGGRASEAPSSSVEAPFDLGGEAPSPEPAAYLDRRPQEDEVTQEYRVSDLSELTDPAFLDQVVDLESAREGSHLSLVESPMPTLSLRERKVQRLESLLSRVQTWRKGLDASQA